MKRSIIYDNRKFTLGTSGRYYFGTVKRKNWSLHRYKYTKEKGEIPKGWHIHHKDGNCFNNDINNLEAIELKRHLAMHRPSKETMDKWQKAGIVAASAWHRSEEGKEWHINHYNRMKDKFHERIKTNCSFCGSDMETNPTTIAKGGNIFCSNNCKSAWRRKNKPDKTSKVCPTCSKEFITLKYLPNTYCSKSCKPAPNPLGYHSRFKNHKHLLKT